MSDRKQQIGVQNMDATESKAEAERRAGIVSIARETFTAAGISYDSRLVISSTDGHLATHMDPLLQTDRRENPNVATVRIEQGRYDDPRKLNNQQLAAITAVVSPGSAKRHRTRYHAKLGVIEAKVRQDNVDSETTGIATITVLVDNLNVVASLDGDQVVGMFVDRWPNDELRLPALAPLLPDDFRYDKKFTGVSAAAHYDEDEK